MVIAERETAGEALTEHATVVLCAWRSLTVETAECMLSMRDMGWGYMIGRGDALIQRVRSRVVTDWYRNTNDDVFLMVDDDVVWEASSAEKVVALAREKRCIVVGAYPVKDGGHLACRGFPGQELVFGEDRPPVQILWPATGFMAVHRDVITAMIGDVPLCGSRKDGGFWPIFDTFWIQDEASGDAEYLSEDYSFGERARRLGFDTWVDQSVILVHLGQYPYHVHNMPKARHMARDEAFAKDLEKITTADGFGMYLDPDDTLICETLRRTGYWDKPTRNAIVANLRPGETFLDLGAHIGYFSLLAAARGNPVIAVEPMAQAADLLEKSAGDKPIELHRVALTDVPAATVPMLASQHNTGRARTLEAPTVESIDVPAATLIEVLAGRWPEFVKIDIEGDEYRILKANPGLLHHARAVVFEVSEEHLRRNSGVGTAELMALFIDAGFQLSEIHSTGDYADWLGVKP